MRTVFISLALMLALLSSAYALDYDRDYLGNRNNNTVTTYQPGLNGSYVGSNSSGQHVETWNRGLNGSYSRSDN